MALRILNSAGEIEPVAGEPVARELETRIESALPGARARVRCRSTGHFEIEVAYAAFAGQPRVRQQQRVLMAIAPLMQTWRVGRHPEGAPFVQEAHSGAVLNVNGRGYHGSMELAERVCRLLNESEAT